MIRTFTLAATVVGCSVAASAAYAGSPYYADPASPSMTAPHGYATHALGTSHVGGGWGNEQYTATAPDETFAPSATAAPVAATTAPATDVVQPVPQYFYHAEGTMGAR